MQYPVAPALELDDGVPVDVVAARLGHADPAIILRVYAHVIRTAEAAMADIFARAVTVVRESEPAKAGA